MDMTGCSTVKMSITEILQTIDDAFHDSIISKVDKGGMTIFHHACLYHSSLTECVNAVNGTLCSQSASKGNIFHRPSKLFGIEINARS
jgi:hypothetical protein